MSDTDTVIEEFLEGKPRADTWRSLRETLAARLADAVATRDAASDDDPRRPALERKVRELRAQVAALAQEGDAVILDKACHATLYDGARLSGAELLRFPHQDLDRFEALLLKARETGRRRVLVAVDAVYSMEGDIAPLPELLALCARHSAVLVVDEAHSTGVMGATGKGLLEHFGLDRAAGHLVTTGTLSKLPDCHGDSLGAVVVGCVVWTSLVVCFPSGMPVVNPMKKSSVHGSTRK